MIGAVDFNHYHIFRQMAIPSIVLVTLIVSTLIAKWWRAAVVLSIVLILALLPVVSLEGYCQFSGHHKQLKK